MAKGLAAFAVGLGSGYLTAQQRGRDQARQDKLDAQGAELHGARMDELNQAKSLRIGLADAVAPREVQAGAVLDGGQTQEFYKDPAQVTPQMQDDRRIEAEMRAEVPGAKPISLATGQVTPGYGTTGKMGLGNMITKDKPDAVALNSPEAKAERIGLAYGANGRPVEAMQFQKNFDDIEQSRKERFAKLQSEGSTRTARAMLSGSPEEVFRTFNAQGKTKLKEAPAVRSEDIDMPGIGKVKNHIYSGVLIDENGQEKPFTMGSHDANMALLGYKDMLEVQRKGLAGDGMADFRERSLDLRGKQIELQGQLGEARIEAAQKKASGSGGFNSMDRMLIDGRVSAARQDLKSIDDKLSDPLTMYAKEGTPAAANRQKLTQQRQEAEAEYKRWGSALATAADVSAQKIAPTAISLANMDPSATKVPAQLQQARDGDRLGILTSELNRAKAQGNQSDIEALTREIGRMKPAQPGLANQRAPAAPAGNKPNYSGLWR